MREKGGAEPYAPLSSASKPARGTLPPCLRGACSKLFTSVLSFVRAQREDEDTEVLMHMDAAQPRADHGVRILADLVRQTEKLVRPVETPAHAAVRFGISMVETDTQSEAVNRCVTVAAEESP